MKTKKMLKKLVVTKETVANLENAGMDKVLGGTALTVDSACYTFCKPECRSHASICCETWDC